MTARTSIPVTIADALALREGAAPRHAGITKLYLDWLSWKQQVILLGAPPECLGANRFSNWDCCPSHRVLGMAFNDLRRRAEGMSRDDPSVQLFSEAWWNAHGLPGEFMEEGVELRVNGSSTNMSAQDWLKGRTNSAILQDALTDLSDEDAAALEKQITGFSPDGVGVLYIFVPTDPKPRTRLELSVGGIEFSWVTF